jgi:DNA methylase
MGLLKGIYSETPLNISEIPNAKLNIENKSRSNPLGWNGQFSPQLIQALLHRYAPPKAVVFDPFLGSGTVLLEAGIANLPASGTEINPAAVVLSQIYTFINVPLEKRRFHLNKIFHLLQDEFLAPLPLFQNTQQGNHWQSAETIKVRLIELPSIAEERLQHQLLEALVVLLDFFKSDLSTDKIFTIWKRLTQYRTVFIEYLEASPLSVDAFLRFLNHILALMTDDTEGNVLTRGYF